MIKDPNATKKDQYTKLLIKMYNKFIIVVIPFDILCHKTRSFVSDYIIKLLFTYN